MTKNKDFVWVVAGGIQQIPMLKEIKSRDLNILLTDGNPDCVGKKYADQFIVMDTYDVFGHLNLAQSMKEKPIAVLAVGADVGPTVSAIADEFDLPAVDYEVAVSVRDKAKMREILELDHPVYMQIKFSDMDTNFTWRMQCRRKGIKPYPCVIKPLDKAGSRGVSLVKSPFEWDSAVKSAQRADDKRNKSFLVEEYIKPEIEIATDNFVVNGKVIFANAVKRYFSEDVFGLELGHINPFDINDEIKRKIRFAVKKLGVDFGPFKCDFIYTKEHGWVIAECATRLSGGFDHMYAAPVATGKDITGFMLDLALGKDVTSRDSRLWNTNKKFAFTYAPIFKPGKVKQMTIPMPLSDEFPWLTNIFPIRTDEFQKLENCSQRPLFIIVEGDNEFQAIRRAKNVEKKIQVEYE